MQSARNQRYNQHAIRDTISTQSEIQSARHQRYNQHAIRDTISTQSEIQSARNQRYNQHAIRDTINTQSEILHEHRERCDVQVVRWLIEYENVRARSEAREQLEPAALATAQLRHVILPTAGRKGKLREQLPRDIHTNGRASTSSRRDPRRDLMREAIKGAISVVNRGHPRSSVARSSCSYRRLSKLLKHPHSLAAVAALFINTELDLSWEPADVIRRNQPQSAQARQSAAISASHRRQSGHL